MNWKKEMQCEVDLLLVLFIAFIILTTEKWAKSLLTLLTQ